MKTIDLDHVALAFERRRDAWPRYGGDLPGKWISGGTANGFANYQLEYANGMRLEVLEPARVEENDFLRRFLDRSGPGPHHLTFKVPDIGAAIAMVEDRGFHPVGINVTFPWWKEMFLHPKEVPGIVIQIAQSEGGDWDSQPPAGFPPARTTEPVVLERVVHAVADLAEGLRVFRDLLGGVEQGAGDSDEGLWVDLAWPGAGRIRLITGPPLDGRMGRLHHLDFVTEAPEEVAGASRIPGTDLWEVPPERNHGTRLVMKCHPAETI